jgi:hypothetical protein
MTELADYSGRFDPAFSDEKLRKDTLVRLLEAYDDYMMRLDGYWYLTAAEKLGAHEAFDCEVRVWEKGQLWELRAITGLLNISGDDVEALMKFIQVSPWMRVHTYSIDLKSPDHGILTVTHCPTLLALEQEGKGRERRICHELEPKMLAIQAGFFNPGIKVVPRNVPPRADYSDCCCRWEFRLDR